VFFENENLSQEVIKNSSKQEVKTRKNIGFIYAVNLLNFNDFYSTKKKEIDYNTNFPDIY
jgi:hypothetical protein